MPTTDFDFLPGRWDVRNRKLLDPLNPDAAEWTEFDAVSVAQPILGGAGNVDQFLADDYTGFSLRLHDPERDVWKIWWSSTQRPGRLDAPVEGRFDDSGRARFECEDEIDGVAFRMAFEWSGITADSARWEQFFSFDDGATWKSNWVMELRKKGV
jgi:hypothetical protein